MPLVHTLMRFIKVRYFVIEVTTSAVKLASTKTWDTLSVLNLKSTGKGKSRRLTCKVASICAWTSHRILGQ